MTEKEEMKMDMVNELTNMLMDKNPSLSMQQALSLVFNSDTYQKLLNDKTKLYYSSPGYVFSYLEHELEYGKIG